MFLKHDDKIVNTDSVTNIVIEDDKIIFNLDYAVSLQDEQDKLIPDYVYMYFNDDSSYNEMIEKINSLNWISSKFGVTYNGRYKDNNRIVNPDAVSFVKMENRKNRIIFNLRNSISFSRNIYSRTSDFVYYDHEDLDTYEDECARISQILTGE